MTAEIIDGRKIAAEVRDDLKQRIGRLQSKGVSPKLATILVGDDPASISYLKGITRTCGDVGVIPEDVRLPATSTQPDLLKKIASLNADATVHGILLFSAPPQKSEFTGS